MGEAKRRRTMFAELTTLTAGQIQAMGAVCAWDGCEATFDRKHGDGGQPPEGWRILYTMKRYSGGVLPNGEPVLRIFSCEAGITRDCVLCPRHAKELEDHLKPLGTEVLAPAQGSA